ncbi:MAG: NotI family restriction endonuclease [Sphingomonas sp.]
MAKKHSATEQARFGIGEWYGHLLPTLSPEKLQEFAKVGSSKFAGVPCPFRINADPAAQCKKKGGVCTLRRHVRDQQGEVLLDGPLVTLCPSRFWSGNEVFGWIGDAMLGTKSPTLVKEVQFLTSLIDGNDEEEGEAVGRIDTILVDPNDPLNWCAMEMQAVYFSGKAMGTHLAQYSEPVRAPIFPDKVRRPDFRSSGPKRLMPQLQVKVPTLRRWGKKMAVVVDKPFFNSLGTMTRVPHISNCDIAWFVVDYSVSDGAISLDQTVFTTLESSVEALTAGVPLSLEAFEMEMGRFLNGRDKRSRSKVIRLDSPTPSPDGGSNLLDGAELPDNVME